MKYNIIVTMHIFKNLTKLFTMICVSVINQVFFEQLHVQLNQSNSYDANLEFRLHDVFRIMILRIFQLKFFPAQLDPPEPHFDLTTQMPNKRSNSAIKVNERPTFTIVLSLLNSFSKLSIAYQRGPSLHSFCAAYLIKVMSILFIPDTVMKYQTRREV